MPSRKEQSEAEELTKLGGGKKQKGDNKAAAEELSRLGGQETPSDRTGDLDLFVPKGVSSVMDRQEQAKGKDTSNLPSLKGMKEAAIATPKETVGLIARPFTDTAGALNNLIAQGAYAMDADSVGDYFSKQAQTAEKISKNLETPLTNEYIDLGASLAFGAIGGGVGYLGAARNLPAVLRGTKAAASAIATGAASAAAEDYAVNQAMSKIIEPKLKKSDLSPGAKQIVRAGVNIGLGMAGGTAVTNRIARKLDDPTFVQTLNRVAQSDTSKGESAAQSIMKKFRNMKPIKEVSEETEPTRPLTKAEAESAPPVQASTAEKRARQIRHGSSAVGGAAYGGVEWDEDGNLTFDPRKAVMGAGVGIAGSTLGVKAAQQAARPFKFAANAYKEKIGQPVWDLIREGVNKKITNSNARYLLGLGKDPDFNDLIRQTDRKIDAAHESARDIGRQLQEIAPSKTEQRRLMQVLRGSITANPEMSRKAEQVRQLFRQSRQQAEELGLMDYSRFDKLSRRELADARKKADAIGDPSKMASIDNIEGLQITAQNAGMDFTPRTQKLLRSSDDASRSLGVTKAVEELEQFRDFQRQRIRDWYHYGSAEEYMPLKYARHEGLTSAEKKEINQEIKRLKKQKKNASPSGQQTLDETIAELEKLTQKNVPPYQREKWALNLGHTMRRQDLPASTQRLLGRIDEAPFPVASGLSQQWEANIRAGLFEEIADNPDWAFKPSSRNAVPENYKLVESKNMGPLQGMAVRNDVYADLQQIHDMRGSFEELVDKTMGLWKTGKVVYNPSTHARNTMSNAILAYFGDVNPWDIDTYSRAAHEVANQGQLYREARDWGLFRNTFAKSELREMRNELGDLRDGEDIKKGVRKLLSLPTAAYRKNEEFFKMAVYTKARKDGMSIDEAAKKAERSLFNYGDIPPAVRHIRRWVSPFFTWTYKAIPRSAETAIKKPWKIGAIGATMYGVEEAARKKFGRSEEEQAARERGLPEWRQGWSQILMPWKDEEGNDQYLDLGYILPYGEVTETWAQTGIPRIAAPQNPVFDMLSAAATNTDPLTGETILRKHEKTFATATQKWAKRIWESAMPPLAPGGQNFEELKNGVLNAFRPENEKVEDWMGDPVRLDKAILDNIFGIKLSKADAQSLQKNLAFERQELKQSFGKSKRELQRQLKQNRITKQEFRDKLKDLQQKQQKMMEKLSPAGID